MNMVLFVLHVNVNILLLYKGSKVLFDFGNRAQDINAFKAFHDKVIVQKIKSLQYVLKIMDYLKNQWIKTRHVYTHLNAFFMVESKYGNENRIIGKIDYKKWGILIHRLHLTPMWSESEVNVLLRVYSSDSLSNYNSYRHNYW